MVRLIISVVVGLFTIPVVVFAVWGAVLVAQFGVGPAFGWLFSYMEVGHFWSGFFMFIGFCVLFVASLPLWA